MSRRPIPLTRSVYLHAYTGLLQELGAPLENDLQKFKLPVSPDESRDTYLPLLPATRFLHSVMLREGIDDFGFRASQRLEFHNLTSVLLSSLRSQLTLHAVLEAVSRLASLEDNYLQVWLEHHADHVRVCSSLVGLRWTPHLEYSDWVQNMMLVCIVRSFAGPQWTPRTMAFESSFVPGAHAREHLPCTLLLTGQNCCWIDMPLSFLAMTRNGAEAFAAPPDNGGQEEPAAPDDFISSFRAMLSAYIGTGCLPVQAAAELAGTSVRTLQRELAMAGLSYNELVQDLRFEEAVRLLKDGEAKIVDVAFSVGYAAPAHFTRAFKRIAGMSPRQFRRMLGNG